MFARGNRADRRAREIAAFLRPEFCYTRPAGGLFVWVELPRHIDTRELLMEAVRERVAFVPGQGFHADRSGTNTMRLNFSNRPPELIEVGMARLGAAVARRLSADEQTAIAL